ncbi:GNAT family N-acetyltransferase [Sphingobacterium sp. Mn56C]|uniref:GNAT family N-acetyltransferase n=1 Tax=Sphingobacterium sp. Mn56C TaxID=3395261 RepID=UPI003BBD82F1
MKTVFENLELVKNNETKRFELTYEGATAFIDFKETASRIALIHTEAPSALAGTGAAAALVEKTLNFIQEDGRKLLPYCPYVFAFIKRNPEWKRIVDPDFPTYSSL